MKVRLVKVPGPLYITDEVMRAILTHAKYRRLVRRNRPSRPFGPRRWRRMAGK